MKAGKSCLKYAPRSYVIQVDGKLLTRNREFHEPLLKPRMLPNHIATDDIDFDSENIGKNASIPYILQCLVMSLWLVMNLMVYLR